MSSKKKINSVIKRLRDAKKMVFEIQIAEAMNTGASNRDAVLLSEAINTAILAALSAEKTIK
jgi:hypothetical protein